MGTYEEPSVGSFAYIDRLLASFVYSKKHTEELRVPNDRSGNVTVDSGWTKHKEIEEACV